MTDEQAERLINALDQNTKANTQLANIVNFVLTNKDKDGNDYIDQKIKMIDKKIWEQLDSWNAMLQPKIGALNNLGENLEKHSRNMDGLSSILFDHIKSANNFSESLTEHSQALKSHSETISEHTYELRNSRT